MAEGRKLHSLLSCLFVNIFLNASLGSCTRTSSNQAKFDDYEEYLESYLGTSKQLALLLDYDGTLTPIVSHPDLAKIPPETKGILERLSNISGVFVAIISGRAVESVKAMVGIDSITYAGNHGLEVIFSNGERYHHQLPTDFSDQVKNLTSELEKNVVRDGAWLENKGATLTFHFRSTPEELRPEIERKAREIMERTGFKVYSAACALEARPKVEWNKGSVAVMLLNNKYGENQWKNDEVKVIFAGDDTTDEDAMKALKGHAATFRISTNPDINTHAQKLLSSTESLVKILKLLESKYKK